MFEIKEITPFIVKLADDKGAEVVVGYKKQTIKYIELSSKKVGDKVAINTATGTSGNLYCTDNMDRAEAFFRAEQLQKKSQLLSFQLERAKALAEAGI
jgi:hypothetical protein